MKFLHLLLVSLFFLRLGAADEYCWAVKHILLKGTTTEHYPRGTRVLLDLQYTKVNLPLLSDEESISTEPTSMEPTSTESARKRSVGIIVRKTPMHFLVNGKIEKAVGLLESLTEDDIRITRATGVRERTWYTFKDRCAYAFAKRTVVWGWFGWRKLEEPKLGETDIFCEAVKHILVKGTMTERYSRGTRLQLDLPETKLSFPLLSSTESTSMQSVAILAREHPMHFLVDRKIADAVGVLANLPEDEAKIITATDVPQREWHTFKDRCVYRFEKRTLVWKRLGRRELEEPKFGAADENCKALEHILLEGKMKTQASSDMQLLMNLRNAAVTIPEPDNEGPFAISFGPHRIEYEVTKTIEKAVGQLRGLPRAETRAITTADGEARIWDTFPRTCAYLHGKEVRKRRLFGWRYIGKAKKSERHIEELVDA